MVFSKSFPVNLEGQTYPQWKEITLSDVEEQQIEAEAKQAHKALLQECIQEAKQIMEAQGLKDFQTNLIQVALALFEKQASHVVYWKERKAKEKFDQLFSTQPTATQP